MDMGTEAGGVGVGFTDGGGREQEEEGSAGILSSKGQEAWGKKSSSSHKEPEVACGYEH